MKPQAHRYASMLLMAIAAPTAFAQSPAFGTPTARLLGDHPAVVVQRLQRTVGYDYSSKFYPHPAWPVPPARHSPDELERMHLAARAAVIDTTPDNEFAHAPIARR